MSIAVDAEKIVGHAGQSGECGRRGLRRRERAVVRSIESAHWTGLLPCRSGGTRQGNGLFLVEQLEGRFAENSKTKWYRI